MSFNQKRLFTPRYRYIREIPRKGPYLTFFYFCEDIDDHFIKPGDPGSGLGLEAHKSNVVLSGITMSALDWDKDK
jgi:hypothetical protein